MTAPGRLCRRFLVSGHVQGVSFRVATRAEARLLALVGFVANLADGRVEVVACGPPQVLAALESWLQRGPPLASVGAVESETCLDQGFADFGVR